MEGRWAKFEVLTLNKQIASRVPPDPNGLVNNQPQAERRQVGGLLSKSLQFISSSIAAKLKVNLKRYSPGHTTIGKSTFAQMSTIVFLVFCPAW